MLSEGEVSEGEVPTVATGDGGSPSARSRTHAAEMGGDAPLADGAAMSDGILVMTERGFGCVGVVGPNGRLLGIVTDGDLRRHMADDLLNRTVDDIMTSAPQTIRPKALAAEALGMMNAADRPFTSLFVSEDGHPCGFLHMHDILRAGIA